MSSPIFVTQGTSTSIKPCQKFEGHTGWVTGVIHLPDRQRIMSCSSGGSLRIWNLKSGKQIGKNWRDGDSGVWTMALSPDGKKVVSGSEDGGMRLWDIDTGKVIAKWMGHTKTVWSVCWSRDGQRVVSGSIDGIVKEWDVEKGETNLGPIKTGHKNVYKVVYSPDMTMFATGGCDELTVPDNEHPVKIWDAKTGKLVATLKGHKRPVFCLAWTLDRKTLISGSSDRSIRTWNTSNWKQIALLDGHTGTVFAIAISPNGPILASTSSDNTTQLWNLDNGQPISSPLHHTNFMNSVSFSSDGKLLATGCDDKNVYTWDISAVLKGAGLDDLLSDKRDNSVSPRVLRGFFDDSPDRARFSARPDVHDISSLSCLFHLARNLLSGGSGSGIERRSVDIPYAKGKRRNACAREKRRPIPKNVTASTSRPNATQQSSGAAQSQSSSQPHATISMPSTIPPAIATPEATTSNTNPHVMIKHAGRWTRFWLFICCTSPEYIDGHY